MLSLDSNPEAAGKIIHPLPFRIIFCIAIILLLATAGPVSADTPTVTGVSPASGPMDGGTTVIITGTGLGTTIGVIFDNTLVLPQTVDSDTQITVISPPHNPGTVDIVVLASGSVSSTSPDDQFTYLALPTVTGLSPASGSTAGGTRVTITGTGFTGATAVRFGVTSGTNLSVDSDTRINITSPAKTPGEYHVTVTATGGTSTITDDDLFTYFVPPPTITGLSPASGPTVGGTRVTVTGTGFTGATAVKFGAASGTKLTVNSSTKITVTSPASPAGIVNVRVTTPGGINSNTSANRFTYAARPTVTGLSPASGPTVGGTRVTVTGIRFTGATAVKFGAASGTKLTVNSSTKITVTSPAGPAGIVNVRVTTPGGISAVTSADRFRYVAIL